jgi:hypothetical protein
MATNFNPAAAASASTETPPVSTGADNASVTGSSPEASGGASATPAAESQGIRQLREAYENLKKTHETYEKFGKPEEIQTRIETYQKLESSALELGATLGYSEDEIRNAMQADPRGTIEFLQRKQAEGGEQNPEMLQLRRELAELKKSLDPLKQNQEQQKLDKARNLFDSTFNEAIKQVYKDENLSNDEMDQLWEDALNLFKQDQAAVKRLVEEGKTSDVQKFVIQARERADKLYLARSGRESKSGGNINGKPIEAPTEKLSIDDIIQGRAPKGHPMSKYFTS